MRRRPGPIPLGQGEGLVAHAAALELGDADVVLAVETSGQLGRHSAADTFEERPDGGLLAPRLLLPVGVLSPSSPSGRGWCCGSSAASSASDMSWSEVRTKPH